MHVLRQLKLVTEHFHDDEDIEYVDPGRSHPSTLAQNTLA